MERIIGRIPYFPVIAIAVILWSCLSIFCYKQYYYPAVSQSSTVLLSGYNRDQAKYELTKGVVYSQTFSCYEELEGLCLYLTSYDRPAEGAVSVSVYAEDGSLLVKKEYTPADVSADGALETPFLEVLPLAERTLRITVEGTATAGRGLFLWTAEAGEKDELLLYRGEEPLPAKLAVGVMRSFNTAAVWIYWGVAVLALVTAGLAYWLACFKKVKIHTLFLVVAAGVGLCYLFLFPPCTVPDESVHFRTAYRLSNVGLGLSSYDDEKGGVWTRECDLHLRGVSPPRFTPDAYRYTWGKMFDQPQNTDLVIRPASANSNRAAYPVQYLFSSFGIWLGRLLSLSLPALYLLARLFNLAAFVMAVYGAIRWIPFGKPVLFGVALLPMTMNVAVSCSYDSITFALAFLVIAFWLRMAFLEQPVRKRDIVLGCLLNMLLAPCKVVYAVLCGLCLLIPARRLGGRKPWLMKMALFLIPALLALLLFQFTIIQGFSETETKILAWGENLEGYTVSWVLQNIPESIRILIRTVLQSGGSLLNQMLGLELGRLELPLPFYCILGYWILLFSSAVCCWNEPVYLNWGHKTWMIFLAFVFSVLTACTMLVGWTPLGNKTIIGLQGRYFIMILPLLLFCLRSRVLLWQKNCETTPALGFAGWQAFTIIFILMKIAF